MTSGIYGQSHVPCEYMTQDRYARDSLDDTTSDLTSSEYDGLSGPPGANTRKTTEHLTSTELALQRIRCN